MMGKKDVALEHDLISGLPVLYPTLAELVKLSQEEGPDLDKLRALLFEDVSLCIKALREINSLEEKKEPIRSLSQGLEALELENFLIKALSSTFYNQNCKEGVWYNRFNQRSVVTALACRFIGEEISYPDLEELYICGLLHYMGILFLKNSFPEEYALVLERKDKGEKLTQVEREILATDHSEAAERAVQEWYFPQRLKIALGGHQLDSKKTGESNLTNIIGVAEQISEVLFAETEPKEIERLSRSWEKNTGLPCGFFERLRPKLLEEVDRRSVYYQNTPEDQTDVVMQAHQMINKFCQTCEKNLKERFRELSKENEEQRKKTELDSLKIVLATFSHYINNATTSIMGRSQLIDIAIKKGEIKDENGKISSSMKIIQQGVENISAVLNGLKKLSSFRTIRYHERSNIIDLRDKIEIKGL